jgi:hypothetical protein
VLAFLGLGAVVAVVVALFAILRSGRFRRGIFDCVIGVGRSTLRVQAYAILLITNNEGPLFGAARSRDLRPRYASRDRGSLIGMRPLATSSDHLSQTADEKELKSPREAAADHIGRRTT